MRRYAIEQSRLYKVTSPKDLAKRLGIEEADLEALANSPANYKRFKTGTTKKRAVEEPKDRLKAVHKKVGRWLGRLEVPEYLHSAIRGKSYVTNATAHRADTNLIKVDIRSFYKNIDRHAVYLFFLNTMLCRQDVAMLLAKLMTVDGHLPTGSPASPILSFFAQKDMFDRIADLANALGLRFTVYVDDMCLSGQMAVRKTLFHVRRIVAQHGLQTHKCRYFPAGVPRVVTGVALTAHGTRLPHERHRKIRDAFANLRELADGNERDQAVLALRSRLFEAGQLEDVWSARAKSLR